MGRTFSKKASSMDQRRGIPRVFWRNVDKRDDGKWVWTGSKNTNHNTVDCQKYEYGEFVLEASLHKPFGLLCRSHMAHIICLFLTFGRELDTLAYEVTPANGDHLDINPDNLLVRNKRTREVLPSSVFFATNDNTPHGGAAALAMAA